MRYKFFGLGLITLLIIATIVPSTASNRRKNMALSILRQARTAHASGDHETAQTLLLKARFIWKDLPDPGWSLPSYHNPRPKKISVDMITRESGNQLLFEFLAHPTSQGKRLLEVYLKKYPDEKAIEEQFLAKGRLVGLIRGEPAPSQTDNGLVNSVQNAKLFLLIIIVCLALWQTRLAIKEILAGPGRLK